MLSGRGNTSISRDVLDVEEKPKTYMTVGERWRVRIFKSDIGVLSGYDNKTLYLLEDDMETAKNMFAELLRHKIEKERRKIEDTINYCNENISTYERAILKLTESEEK